VRVASVTGPGEIRRSVIPAMHARNDVLDMRRRKRKMFLLEETVFTVISSSATTKFADRSVHQLGGRPAAMARALACKIPTRSIAST
jgi:hypothetical protein